MKILVLYVLTAVFAGYLVGKDAFNRDNKMSLCVGLGVFFGLIWPATALLWLLERKDDGG